MAHVSKLLSFQVIHCTVCSCTHLILPLNKTYPPIHLTHNSSKHPPLIFEPMTPSKIWISAPALAGHWPFLGGDGEAAPGSRVLNSHWPLTRLTFPTVQLPPMIADWSGFRAFKTAPQQKAKSEPKSVFICVISEQNYSDLTFLITHLCKWLIFL